MVPAVGISRRPEADSGSLLCMASYKGVSEPNEKVRAYTEPVSKELDVWNIQHGPWSSIVCSLKVLQMKSIFVSQIMISFTMHMWDKSTYNFSANSPLGGLKWSLLTDMWSLRTPSVEVCCGLLALFGFGVSSLMLLEYFPKYMHACLLIFMGKLIVLW